jgi:hypothetical protein
MSIVRRTDVSCIFVQTAQKIFFISITKIKQHKRFGKITKQNKKERDDLTIGRQKTWEKQIIIFIYLFLPLMQEISIYWTN